MDSIGQFFSELLYLDTETTALDPKVAEIIEIGGFEPSVDNEGWGELFGSINPISPETSAINHISNRMIAGRSRFDQRALQVLHPRLKPGRQKLVAHNAKFDRTMLKLGCQNAGFDSETLEFLGDESNWICTWRLTQALVPNLPLYKMDYLRYAFDLDTDQYSAHRASADVMVTHELVKYLVMKAFENEVINMESDIGAEFVKLSGQPILHEKWPFGKYKGQPLKDIPADYFSWALGPTGMDMLKEGHASFNADLAMTLQKELERRGVI